TGHEGGAGTLHANTPADVPARLEALGLLGGLPRAALHAQVAAALQVVLHLRRAAGGRILDSVCLLLPGGPERFVTAVPAWRRRAAGPGADAVGPTAPGSGRARASRAHRWPGMTAAGWLAGCCLVAAAVVAAVPGGGRNASRRLAALRRRDGPQSNEGRAWHRP